MDQPRANWKPRSELLSFSFPPLLSQSKIHSYSHQDITNEWRYLAGSF
uniref:Uncharacterized protein n=1 Tax=Arundo donax TaxID=35708 RepID=A0A0A9HFT4_ARUDO